MEKKLKRKNSLNRNIFNKLNFVKGTKINYNYRNVVNKLDNFSNRFSQFIEYLENSIENDMNFTGRKLQKKLGSIILAQKFGDILKNRGQKIHSNRSLILNPKNKNKMNFSFLIPRKKKQIKNILGKKETNNINNEERKENKLNIYHQKAYSSLRKGPTHLNNSATLNNKKKFTNFFQTKNLSVSNPKINSGISSAKNGINQYNYIPNKNKKNTRIIRAQSAMTSNSGNEYNNNRINKTKNKSSNMSKNLSLSLYKTNKNIFSSYKDVLKPELLMKFVKKSKKIQSSYKKDFDVYLPKKTQSLLKTAEDEINMKDPDFYHRQIFKNVLEVKKTVRFVRRMRAENKTRVKYYGPGNVNNESLMRTKNANLIRFCDSIIHMKDDKFYKYRTFLNEYYPTLTKETFKQKYQISEKDDVYLRKCNENQLKIDRLFAIMQKQ